MSARAGHPVPLLAVLALSALAGSASAQVVTEYNVPSGSLPTGIATGSDGNLWFTEPNHNAIGRITQYGVVVNGYFQ